MKLTTNLNSPFFLDQYFDNFLKNSSLETTTKNVKCDLAEDKDNFYCELDAPGFSKKDISIQLAEGQLAISGKKDETKKSGDKTYYVQERTTNRFSRLFNLPNSISSENISAKYNNGVLSIKLPKVKEAKAKLIEISS